jgi:hypothetical protein
VGFSIRATIRAFVAPKHRIRCSRAFWRELNLELCRRSERCHESGAFLLGRIVDGSRECLKTIYYDELDQDSYASGVCVLTAKSFGKLWKICRESEMTIVADIHTHVGSAFQSAADRTNPMIAEKGHIAFIAPFLCCKGVEPQDLCVFEYLGGHRWVDHTSRADRFFYVGFWS